MAENSAIEWTDHTFNPWEGCQRVGPGCDHCYAEARNARFGGGAAPNWGPGAPRRRTSAANWRKPLAWNADAVRFAEQHGRKQRVFCSSLADVFDNAVHPDWRSDLFELIHRTPNLDWLLLTKRIGNVERMIWDDGEMKALPPHVWLGATVVNQAEADRDIPKLLAAPAAVRFLSCEPLLGQVDLSPWLSPETACQGCDDGEGYGNRCARSDIPRLEQCPWTRAVLTVVEHGPFNAEGMPSAITCEVSQLDWVIVGGESGPGARPMHPDWARSLRDQCAAAGVPYLFKQWGEWVNEVQSPPDAIFPGEGRDPFGQGEYWAKLGKKRAGRLLDGVQHDGMPQ